MRTTSHYTALDHIPEPVRIFTARRSAELAGLALIGGIVGLALALTSWSVQDPSFNHAADGPIRNFLGAPGAVAADLLMQMLGLGVLACLLPPGFWGWRLLTTHKLDRLGLRLVLWLAGMACAAGLASLLPPTHSWPLPTGLGGVLGDAVLFLPQKLFASFRPGLFIIGAMLAAGALLFLAASIGLRPHPLDAEDLDEEPVPTLANASKDEDAAGEPGLLLVALTGLIQLGLALKSWASRFLARRVRPVTAKPAPWQAGWRETHGDFDPPLDLAGEPLQWLEPAPEPPPFDASAYAPRATREAVRRERAAASSTETRPAREVHVEEEQDDYDFAAELPPLSVTPPAPPPKPSARALQEKAPAPQSAPMFRVSNRNTNQVFELPPLAMLSEPKKQGTRLSDDALQQNARVLEGVLEDFGVKGEIINVRPGPVVTLYELEPAPGIKSSRVIGLADDIARSMSALSARVAVVQGRNAIGIELPNLRRETVFLRELLSAHDFEESKHKLAIALGKNIGGEPIIVDLARMPHLLVAGTTGSGKSVAINTMILSLLYRLKPDQCRLIMVDPKMLELSVYDGIPHLLTPVVTDPKKAVVALKWAVREMEDRYKKMSKVGVRNIDGFNARVAEATAKGEVITRVVQTGFDRETGEAIYEQEEMNLSVLPYIVVIVDEMADLMMVAGKDIEGAIQRLAQMARAAGIHLIMATQRPSVDVITGTIKANFPTRISFQVTSKIDSRTILGEQGAEQLLGQGDMLYMAGGGRISRVHGPFVSDGEVEKVVAHLKTQGQPDYLDAITAEDEEGEDGEAPAPGSMDAEEGGDLYDRAVAIVLRDKKCSTSYIQRRLSVGYNKAASLVERMEKEGVVGAPNHAGKRAILVGGGVDRGAFDLAAEG
ncbi:DNA translocase FtsK [Beijerinckia indica]|uniref:DNA translocase FtsK n=1 Tax=Beijerinckia indica subsp. indica (strain ATCC 9039 / DSM 1715 / NCIMB 8712) TaxID=395963 RepID=B2IE97_BEII9|nr:DNA translocase FtsK [Beijerinckia indica]ACB94117.1 cell divisionFtsK/SpoIIIE [Beijerinckia indica subsp. indica ATCC 9039]